MRRRFLCCAIVALIATNAARADDEALPPGISATPPEEGTRIETPRGYMVPYRLSIPACRIAFEMVPIPGGRFRLGSPENEEGHERCESPQVEVDVPPFWIGRYEITWADYRPFMSLEQELKAAGRQLDHPHPDAISAPSLIYQPTYVFECGQEPDLPAATMSQFAAKQYTKWITHLTGACYRLPTEVEWEYACRAGTTTAYSFGDDAEKLNDFAWFSDSSDETTHPVGRKKANPWGLYDMHGNVAEWVLDQFSADGYRAPQGEQANAANMIAWPDRLYPRVLRGGSFISDAAACRCAARLPSDDKTLRESDPNLPASPWWFAHEESHEAHAIGFRVVRPLTEPAAADCTRFWDADIEDIRDEVAARIQQGRGALGLVRGAPKSEK